MAKSKIIKDLVTNDVSISVSLRRLKVLLTCLKKPELVTWVDSELDGYKDNNDLPLYRILKGNVKGSFHVGTKIYQNTPIPIDSLTKEKRDFFEICKLCQSIGSVEDLLKDRSGTYCTHINPVFFGILRKSSNIESIVKADTELARSQFVSIVEQVTNKVLSILILLEDEFGLLDDMDIDTTDKSSNEVERISQLIIQIIYQNDSITIGNNNKISRTKLNTKNTDNE